jgi:prepilin-type N-terminal cleavage/methylation domain-containing protein
MTNNRRGLSLLEVILAIAILGGALATIGELIRIGARNAAISRDLTTAQLYCESKMNEAAAGVIDLENLETETLDEEGDWMCVITTEALDQQQLIAVNVTVGQNPDEYARPVSFSMTRWIIDPAYVAECAALDAKLKAEAKQRVANAAQSAGSTADAGAAAGGGTADAGSGGQQAGGGQTGGGTAGGGFGGVPGGGAGPGGRGGPGGGRGGEPGNGENTDRPRNPRNDQEQPVRPNTDRPRPGR